MDRDFEHLVSAVIDCGMQIHRRLGPGLFEIVYEKLLLSALSQRGIDAKRQVPMNFTIDGMFFEDGYRADLLVENQLIVEIKCIDRLAPVHTRQLLTYLRLAELPLGLLVNFGGETFREGIKRVVNNYSS